MTTAQQELEKSRHSLAHVLAYAVKRLYPEAKIGIGPVTETGFYYEFDLSHKFNHEELQEIELEMKKIIDEDLTFVNITIPKEQATQTLLQLGETYKSELLDEIPDSEVSFYKTGEDFIDLCRGPHVKSTGELGNFKLIDIKQSHWKNDHTRPIMQRIEGIAFNSRTKLDQYLSNINRIKEVNSIEIGQKLGFFIKSEDYASSPIFLGKGIQLFEEIKAFVRKQMYEEDILMIYQPYLYTKKNNSLESFKKFINIEPINVDLETVELRYLNTEFLLNKFTENQKSGLTLGTLNTTYTKKKTNKNITQLNDFIENTSANALSLSTTQEISSVLEVHLKLIGKILKALGFNQFKAVIELPDYEKLENYFYDAKLWDTAIDLIKSTITHLKLPTKIREGGAAFYGPRIGLTVKDKFLRDWRISNIVVDPMLPNEWKLGKPGSSFFVHSNIVESIEKLVDLLLEHGEGRLPLWLAPTQVKIISMGTNFNHKAIKIMNDLRDEGFRVEVDVNDTDPESKVAESLSFVYPYVLIIGEKEVANDAISVKTDTGDNVGLMRTSEIIQKLKLQIQEELAN